MPTASPPKTGARPWPRPPQLPKLALTAHVIASVGWLGAVACFLALSLTGLTSQNPPTVRSAYLVMELTGWLVLVPLSLASLLTGLVCSLGSPWGLVRHYWVLFRLLPPVAVPLCGGAAAVRRESFAEMPAVCIMDAGNNGVVILAESCAGPAGPPVLHRQGRVAAALAAACGQHGW